MSKIPAHVRQADMTPAGWDRVEGLVDDAEDYVGELRPWRRDPDNPPILRTDWTVTRAENARYLARAQAAIAEALEVLGYSDDEPAMCGFATGYGPCYLQPGHEDHDDIHLARIKEAQQTARLLDDVRGIDDDIDDAISDLVAALREAHKHKSEQRPSDEVA